MNRSAKRMMVRRGIFTILGKLVNHAFECGEARCPGCGLSKA